MYRPEMNIFIHAEINATLGCFNLIEGRQGVREIENETVVSGGVIAPAGAVVVDSIYRPTKVFGIADGRGFLVEAIKLTDQQLSSIKKIERFIDSSILN
jgi:hypothetical protein